MELLTLEQLTSTQLAKLDNAYTLVYPDYRDSLDDQPKLVELYLKDRLVGMDAIYEEAEEWYWQWRLESVGEVVKDTYGDDWDNFTDDLRDAIYEAIMERDDSDMVGDLIRHTGRQFITYDLGYDLPEMGMIQTRSERYNHARAIAKCLGVSFKDNKAKLYELIDNATYGGLLKLVWYGDIEIGDGDTLEMDNPYVAIIDYCNGSGHDVQLNGTAKVAFDRSKLELDKLHRYNYSDEVCALYLPAFEREPRITTKEGK